MKRTERYKLVEVDNCVCSTTTGKAILVACEGEEVWVPTSQIHEDSEVYKPGTEGILVIPQWVAEMKELPYRETRMVR
jgi:hypothetical protein